MEFDCHRHESPFECPDAIVIYHPLFREYGLPIRDGGPSYLAVSHCSFCGSKLPRSERDDWFEAIKSAGLGDDDEIPPHFLKPNWRRAKKNAHAS